MTRKKKEGHSVGADKTAVPEEPAATAEGAEMACEDKPAHFPVVGIGASAGGLAAFEAFFSGMPPDTHPDMAFVLVQHLAPDHKSILVDLIKRYTRMDVFEVQDGMAVRPNCVYIIPPNCNLAFFGGALQVLEAEAPRGQRMPIDFFFRSLAQDQRERGIGIVLSGTGSDGTLGVRSIKGEGGMIMAQIPESCEYDGMPRSAIATGLVDYELPPADMPAQLKAYVSRAFDRPPKLAAAAPPRTENALKKIFVLLRSQTSHDFSLYKLSTVNRRIERRMAVHQIETMDRYVRFLQQSPGEVEALFRDLLIGVTSFFRDPFAFQALAEQGLPKIFADKPAGSLIRVWVPGCSTGEEAYSIAILLTECQEVLKRSFTIQIFATDIDSHAIATARNGVYLPNITADVSPERLARFFVAETDGSAYRIHKTIRDLLVFSEQDVLKDPPFSKLDLVSCRNLLIYMTMELQRKLIPLFHYALNPEGLLFLGTSETVGDHVELFVMLDRKYKLYQRKAASPQMSSVKLMPPLSALEQALPQVARRAALPRLPSVRELTEQTLLQQVLPVAALVKANGDILYLHGRTGLYLEPTPGEPGVQNILKMAREGLQYELSAALRRAAAGQEVVTSPNLRVKANGSLVSVNLTVCPVASVHDAEFEAPLFVVVLQEGAPVEAKTAENADNASGTDARIAALQEDLRSKEEYLQSTNEELETVNEELKSSNEEMQSVNEELQSTNEELETSKEELQSVNEELSTVNAELQNKVADLTRAYNDMNNLLAGTGIATLFVDHSLNIMRFTPSATQIVNLIQSDVGRPLKHFVANFDGYNTLLADTQSVLDTLVPNEREVRTLEGRVYLMRIYPYRTLENVIEGAVLTFVDITERRQVEEAMRVGQTRMKMAQKAAKSGIWDWSIKTGEIEWSEEFYLLLGIPGEVKPSYEKWMETIHPHDREAADRAVKEAIAQKKTVNLDFRARRPDGSVLWLNSVGEVLYDDEGDPVRMIGITMDISNRKLAESALRDRGELYQAFVMASADVVYRMSPDWSEMRQLHGRDFIPDTETPSKNWLQKYIHPDDQPQVLAIINEATRTKSIFELEHRVLRVDGSLGLTFSRAVPILDAEGEIIEWVGTARDVTAEREARATEYADGQGPGEKKGLSRRTDRQQSTRRRKRHDPT